MKNIKFLTLVLAVSTLFIGCSKDDDARPLPVNEEEVITTLTVTLVPNDGSTAITLQTRDLDGDGPNEPVITTGNLATGVTYSGSIVLLNESVNPAENITDEVEEESNEHQFFYTAAAGLDVTTSGENLDSEGNKLGTEFTLVAGAVSSGTLTFTLRHEPNKPNTGLNDAGGESDVIALFNVAVQ
ncbi:type 1 periplasmic binding fold superfamily protein [Flavobacteriaceae bacterium]|nr:type 1 periplasmic binding fold superfamily protein [Flavobacteriaceae bacterium]MDB9954810.1 type 1 periplasmic binding fold superfamily protein [Flavobacteriaceae bacterium]